MWPIRPPRSGRRRCAGPGRPADTPGTTYALAVPRHDQVARLIRHPKLRQGSRAVARLSRRHPQAICRLVGELGAQPGSRTIRPHSRLVVAASQPGSAAGSRIWPMWPASCSQTACPASAASASASAKPVPAADRPHQRGEPLDDRTPRRLVAVTRAHHQVSDRRGTEYRACLSSHDSWSPSSAPGQRPGASGTGERPVPTSPRRRSRAGTGEWRPSGCRP